MNDFTFSGKIIRDKDRKVIESGIADVEGTNGEID